MSGDQQDTRGVDPTSVIWRQLDALAKTIERNHNEVISRQQAIHEDVVGLADKAERELGEIRVELAAVDTKVGAVDTKVDDLQSKVETLHRAEKSLAGEVAALKSWTTGPREAAPHDRGPRAARHPRRSAGETPPVVSPRPRRDPHRGGRDVRGDHVLAHPLPGHRPMSSQDDVETLVTCPACARCYTCGGSGKVVCYACNDPHHLSCGYCEACGVCDGKRMTTASRAASFCSTPERF